MKVNTVMIGKRSPRDTAKTFAAPSFARGPYCRGWEDSDKSSALVPPAYGQLSRSP